MAITFKPGWNPDVEKRARDAYLATPGVHVYTSSVFAADDRPLPGGYSLSGELRWPRNQGPVGSCAPNSGVAGMELATSCAVSAGATLAEKQLSRWFLWYEARRRDGLLGGGEGASITNIFRAAKEEGVPTEAIAPYSPEYHYLERKPPAAAYAEAKDNRYTGYYPIKHSDRAARRRAIFNGHPLGIGIWWPYGWSTSTDRYGRTTGVGSGQYGHALQEIGWLDDWDGYSWVQLLNSHGLIYGVPPAEIQRRIVGYRSVRPDRCYSFWVREDHYASVLARGNVEMFAAAGLDGFQIKNLFTNWGKMFA